MTTLGEIFRRPPDVTEAQGTPFAYDGRGALAQWLLPSSGQVRVAPDTGPLSHVAAADGQRMLTGVDHNAWFTAQDSPWGDKLPKWASPARDALVGGVNALAKVADSPAGWAATFVAPGARNALLPGEGAGRRLAPKRFQIDYYNTPVTVMQNPSNQALSAFIGKTKYKAARRVTDEHGNTFVWDANDPALHALMAEQLGLPKGKWTGDMIGID